MRRLRKSPKAYGASITMNIVTSYFERIGRRLKAEGDAARSFQHGLNRGQIREAFIREFLAQNLSEFWDIGTGEIIHRDASPEDIRPQIDVVVHNKKFPKLSLAAGIDLFFIETVSAFIEIKSRLTKETLRKAVTNTKEIKSAANFPSQRFNPRGMIKTPRPYSFVFSYDGPKRIETILKWLKELSTEDDYGLDTLKAADPRGRSFFNHSFIDGVFVLGRGFVFVDTLPFHSQIAAAIEKGLAISPNEMWVFGKDHELLMLWAALNEINSFLLWSEHDLASYIGTIGFYLDVSDSTNSVL